MPDHLSGRHKALKILEAGRSVTLHSLNMINRFVSEILIISIFNKPNRNFGKTWSETSNQFSRQKNDHYTFLSSHKEIRV